MGLKLFHQDEFFRIEEFFEGRPLSLWEMRNPIIAKRYADKICDFNFNPLAQKYVKEIEPLDEENLFIHQVINEWGPNLVAKIDKLKAMLKEAGTPAHLENLKKAELLQETFLFEGYQDYFESLIPKPGQPSRFDPSYINPFPNVLTHNDGH